jgi:hypothetical protein
MVPSPLCQNPRSSLRETTKEDCDDQGRGAGKVAWDGQDNAEANR